MYTEWLWYTKPLSGPQGAAEPVVRAAVGSRALGEPLGAGLPSSNGFHHSPPWSARLPLLTHAGLLMTFSAVQRSSLTLQEQLQKALCERGPVPASSLHSLPRQRQMAPSRCVGSADASSALPQRELKAVLPRQAATPTTPIHHSQPRSASPPISNNYKQRYSDF